MSGVSGKGKKLLCIGYKVKQDTSKLMLCHHIKKTKRENKHKKTHKRTQGIFVGDKYMYYLDCGDDITDLCIYPNSSR